MLQKILIKFALTLLLEWLNNQSRNDYELANYLSDNTSLSPGAVFNLFRVLRLGDNAVVKAVREN